MRCLASESSTSPREGMRPSIKNVWAPLGFTLRKTVAGFCHPHCCRSEARSARSLWHSFSGTRLQPLAHVPALAPARTLPRESGSRTPRTKQACFSKAPTAANAAECPAGLIRGTGKIQSGLTLRKSKVQSCCPLFAGPPPAGRALKGRGGGTYPSGAFVAPNLLASGNTTLSAIAHGAGSDPT